MAWTSVRTDRESFVSTAAAKTLSANIFAGSEIYFVIFIAVQVAQSGFLWLNNQFDPVLGIFQSVSLLAAAGLFASKRAALAPDVAAAGQPDRATALAPALVSTIPIDEQSQTWADLMGRISHEIRTPLNAVIGFSDLMEREIFGPLGNDRYRDYLAHIRESGEALLRSAEDTLALSSMLAVAAPGQRVQSSSLAALAQDAWVFAEPQAARRGIGFHVNIPDGLDVAGDRRAFRQALSNLMLEAVDRATTGSRIEIEAAAHGDTVTIKVGVPDAEQQMRPAQPSLAMCVARALLELQGTALTAAECAERGSWQAGTVLTLAVQPDFFGG